MGAHKFHGKNRDWYLETPVTNNLYVDKNRADDYTENGSDTRPFKTIQAAIDSIASPSAANKFVIDIAPGAYYSEAVAINKVYTTFRSCGVNGARISGKITVTNPTVIASQITFVGLRISGGLDCFASHICINVVDCNVTGTAWNFNPTIPTDDEYFQVWSGIWYADVNLTNVYSYLMGGGFYSTFAAENKEFNVTGADINQPFQVILNGTIIASAYGNKAGNVGGGTPTSFIINSGAALNIGADTEGGSVVTVNSGGILNRTTKGTNVANAPAGTIIATDVQAAINELDTKKSTKDIYSNQLFVDINGNDSTGDGSIENPYLTPQKAHDAASAEMIINLGGGLYENNLTITKKNLTFYGRKPFTVIKGLISVSGSTGFGTFFIDLNLQNGGVTSLNTLMVNTGAHAVLMNCELEANDTIGSRCLKVDVGQVDLMNCLAVENASNLITIDVVNTGILNSMNSMLNAGVSIEVGSTFNNINTYFDRVNSSILGTENTFPAASNVPNDSSVAGNFVKDALETLKSSADAIITVEVSPIDIGTSDVDSLLLGAGDGCIWHYVIKKGDNKRAGTVTAVWTAADKKFNVVGTEDLGTIDITLAVINDLTNLKLQATAASDGWSVKVKRILI